jgi:ArsR family transcriptional regulator, virulence genes transcriptional regulator
MNLQNLNEAADKASNFLKSLGNAHRLRILCLMMEEERPVGDLAEAVGLAQSAVSQHLARMRQEGLIKSRRDGQTIYYQLADKNVARTLKLLESMFCSPA